MTNTGFINLNKPAGFTSHDCVAKMRRLLKTKKIGHGGTLDPSATGVLPIAVGKATRLLQFLPEPKAYRARIRLGVTTTTDDLEGEIISSQTVQDLKLENIKTYLNKLTGTIEQVPPMYSAIKQEGKKLYELARKGKQVDVPSRIVTINELKIIEFTYQDFPELEIEINCSPGTYIRAIARDLGSMLGVGGTLANLIRIESSGMKLSDSLTFIEIEQQLEAETFNLIPPSQALNHLDTISLNNQDALHWCQGQKITIKLEQFESKQSLSAPEMYLKVIDEHENFLGITQLINQAEDLLIKPKIVCANLEQ
ncbi:tRNA pseudouridine synthase B [Stanieria cyanosphaera PCC 7437]|uniref:tRNA pseudouridine synthase B n=1 Tax=Stanieria cyanosphaera (strain ATCC 29371 / PCC 7437) TaxID=111780 RepID=K9XYU3_STAC7|nr:tRNA pseudouridine(55) synthase TruB [Stanieria cyanosphaera]AFZ37199.1 tRNA pseudouridine synthase B [Stanieria cyanosphaera PCC 7437]